MAKENKKISRLNIAIGLGMILFVVILVINVKGNERKAEPSKKEETIMQQQAAKPVIREIEGTFAFEDQESPEEQVIEEGEDELPPVFMIKDLPIEQIQKETEQRTKDESEEAIEETEEPASSLQTDPSLEDMKMIKKKGLVIY